MTTLTTEPEVGRTTRLGVLSYDTRENDTKLLAQIYPLLPGELHEEGMAKRLMVGNISLRVIRENYNQNIPWAIELSVPYTSSSHSAKVRFSKKGTQIDTNKLIAAYHKVEQAYQAGRERKKATQHKQTELQRMMDTYFPEQNTNWNNRVLPHISDDNGRYDVHLKLGEESIAKLTQWLKENKIEY